MKTKTKTRRRNSSARPAPEADPVLAYARAVVEGDIVASRWVRLAGERHLRDLERKDLVWDLAAAQRIFRFFRNVLRLNGGQFEGKPFELIDFEQFIVGSIFGWKLLDGTRRYQMAYVEIGKGNGKSPLAGGIGMAGLIADGEARAEIYAAATKKDQAMILFRDAVAMRDQSPHLRDRLVKSGVGEKCWNMAYRKTGSWFKPISSDEDSQSGPRPHMALIDEVHEHKTNVVISMLEEGFKWRRNPLLFMITNSGSNRETVCYYYHDYVTKILKQTANNDRMFGFIAALDPCDDHWRDGQEQPIDNCPKCDDWRVEGEHWRKANPALDHIVTRQRLRDQVRKALDMPSEENTVRRLNFCYWTNQATRWMSMEAWDSCAKPIDYAKLKGRQCILGVDLANTIDIAAVALLFAPDNFKLIEPAHYVGAFELSLLNATEMAALQYVVNSAGGATLQNFIEDHEPIGAQLWGQLRKFGLVYIDPDGRIRRDPERVSMVKSAAETVYGQIDVDHLNDDFIILPYFFIPEGTIEEAKRRDDVPYDMWVKQGLIEATPGNVIDYGFIKHRIAALKDIYPIRTKFEQGRQQHLAGFDPWNATQFAQDMQADYGLNMIEVRQGYQTMSEPTKEMARIVKAGRLRHGGNPVLRWMADNMVVRSDPAGNIKPDKEKSKKKIDGIVALIIALALAIRNGHADNGGVFISSAA